MGLKDDLDSDMAILDQGWAVSAVQKGSDEVPDPDKMGYDEGKEIQAVYLYTDLMNSSKLIKISSPKVAASVLAAFLKAAVRIIRANKGHVRSFDGDRVMGVFAGPNRSMNAVNAAMQINGFVSKTLNTRVRNKFPALLKANWELRTMTGVAKGSALLIRVGLRGNSDMVSVGTAPNFAAALSDLRDRTSHRVAIGGAVYAALGDADLAHDGKLIWLGPFETTMGGQNFTYYRTSHVRMPK